MNWDTEGIIVRIIHCFFLSILLTFFVSGFLFTFSFFLKNTDSVWRCLLVAPFLTGSIKTVANIIETIRWAPEYDSIAYEIANNLGSFMRAKTENQHAKNAPPSLTPDSEEGDKLLEEFKKQVEQLSIASAVDWVFHDYDEFVADFEKNKHTAEIIRPDCWNNKG